MDGAETIARAFVEARRAATPVADYPGARPTTLADAYAVQDRAIALRGGAVAGWKVGRVPAPYLEQLGVPRLAGPIFSDQIRTAADAAAALPVIAGGFAAVEAEYLLRIGSTPAPGTTLTAEQAVDLVDAVHVGFEIASSPYAGINADGPLVTISDFGNHNALRVGAPVPDWRSRAFEDWQVSTHVDGACVGGAQARTMLDGPFGAVAFLVESLARRGLTLLPGQWISSGAVTGVHPVAVGAQVEARFGELRVSGTIEAAARQESMSETKHGEWTG
ncbi:2-keto-4-pentenoate hydratase [Sphingomonas sp. ac-8]|uniref:2-keto-4-pentenoate hydratase n=1 Tax=Sphingomonas sp. ac-8 TaxID=3242977 RepID=UPI003A80D474